MQIFLVLMDGGRYRYRYNDSRGVRCDGLCLCWITLRCSSWRALRMQTKATSQSQRLIEESMHESKTADTIWTTEANYVLRTAVLIITYVLDRISDSKRLWARYVESELKIYRRIAQNSLVSNVYRYTGSTRTYVACDNFECWIEFCHYFVGSTHLKL